MMKTKVLFFAGLMLVSGAVLARVEEPVVTGMVVMPVKGSQVYKVIYKAASAGNAKLSIYDPSGNVILSQTFYGVDGFICPLNFSGLRKGSYTLELTDSSGTKTSKIDFDGQKSAIVHVSKLKEEQGRYLLSVAGANGNPVTVRVYDAHQNLVYSETLEESADFARVFKITESGGHTFEVSDNNGTIKTVSF